MDAMIDWESQETHVLTNPRMDPIERERVTQAIGALKTFKGHVWIATSGTTSTAKWAALSKEAILCSAASVNRHLESDSQDVWINPLPNFHVGGLAIGARCYLSGAQCVPYAQKWDPKAFYNAVQRSKATLTSLVPAQLHDLVHLNMTPPPSLRAIFVGGGRLSDVLYRAAWEQGWRILHSYGMTECCSQVATAEIPGSSPRLRILDHMEIRISEEGLIGIRSPALLTAYALISEAETRIYDPKQEGWLTTNDRGRASDLYLEVLGRQDDVIKIGGENVDFAHLESILERVKGTREMALVPVPDSRLGHAVHLCTTGQDAGSIVDRFNAMVMPYERIRKVEVVAEIPKTTLGKVKKRELLMQLQGAQEVVAGSQ
jgi:O-succinylbenzoic acid--CoA ligase